MEPSAIDDAKHIVQGRLLYWAYNDSVPMTIPEGISETEWVAFGKRIVDAMVAKGWAANPGPDGAIGARAYEQGVWNANVRVGLADG